MAAMTENPPGRIAEDTPIARQVCEVVRQGDVEALRQMLASHPGLATARITSGCGSGDDTQAMSRSLLHIATDWPGNLPRGAETVAVLVAAGADVNARFESRHTETPLHWAASSDDVAVLDALLDAGANIEAAGAVIAGGTPLADAVAFGQWKAARRLIERGAQATLWQAAALGLMDRVANLMTDETVPAAEITKAFWCACHGGQREAAEYLLGRGADINWIGYDGLTALGAARRSGADDVAQWLLAKGGR